MTEIQEYRHLKPYETPRDYGGATWFGWFSVYGQHRDSDALGRSNYRRILEDLRALDTELQDSDIDKRDESTPGDSTVTDTRCGHWAVGWVETIYVHSSNIAACLKADEVLSALERYPVYDESDFSELETEGLQRYWSHCGMRERIDICKRAGASILQARHDSISIIDSDLYDWYSEHYRD